ncbi:hypothetical protein [Alicyclobacillus sp. ALC3]|uniref:hypothetical protein n=1 Tax=Alicyclobacillus sp. ALC3 TaxID=2796143 RepID=UPI002378ADD9|nr:hypothetical protein [Alicyclobacillus sp. ALC3]
MSEPIDQDQRAQATQPMSPFPIHSNNSGSYHPGPIGNEDGASPELSYVQAWQDDLQLEEFAEGPYGAATAGLPGKSSPWQRGQAVASAHRDQNPVDSDRKLAAHEPPFEDPPGTQEGQN